MAKRILKDFRISEISAVDRPAQQGARMVLMKRVIDFKKFKIEKSDHDLAEIIVKAWVDPAAGARSFSSIVQECVESEKYQDRLDEFWPYTNALNTSLNSILGDANLDDGTRMLGLRQSVEEFLSAVRTDWPEISGAVEKKVKGEVTMTDKTISKEDADKLVKDAGEKLAKEHADALAKINSNVEALTKSVTDLTAENKALVLKAGMSDDEKAHADSLPTPEDKKKFAGMEPADRKAAMTKKAEGDEVIKVEGRDIRKSVVGEDMFAILKGSQKKMDDLAKQAQEDRDARVTSELTKRATDDFGHLPGKVEDTVAVLKSISGLPEAQRTHLETMLKAGDKAISAAFGKLGNKGGADPTNLTKAQGFTKRVDEIVARDKIGKSAAMTKARKEDPEGFAAYQEGSGAN